MKKFIAPIICGSLGIVAICLYFLLIGYGINTMVSSIVIGIIVMVLVGAMIFTINQRIREIKEEDKDDISKY
ncbi:hypothetical protein [Tepidibacter hydrothermalis]|uniref:Uncharacterized protein n=1 Tax=Tepidibacter hydrothermalis TaxID=3036126 RepID=A0ABY8EGF9_9FIRM|nr:hypothetical protein [Tepidibacter hydrothermalis]WFD10669.1 hypothetical protein P4S50_00945 [Tepidibacter hydrothermalis]